MDRGATMKNVVLAIVFSAFCFPFLAQAGVDDDKIVIPILSKTVAFKALSSSGDWWNYAMKEIEADTSPTHQITSKIISALFKKRTLDFVNTMAFYTPGDFNNREL